MAPSLLHFGVFIVWPILFSFYLSFHDYSVLETARRFVGLGNYARLLSDPAFFRSLLNTVSYVALEVALTTSGSLCIALLLNRKMRGRSFLRGAFYSPTVVSYVAASLVWLWIYDPLYGVFDFCLRKLGLPGVGWLQNPAWALPSLALMGVWKSVGYYMVIYLAGLQSIPRTYYEAGAIDGATGWSAFLHITWPLLMPYTLFVVVVGVIQAFQVFAPVYVMTKGGPLGATSVIVFYLYEQAFTFYKMGYASAVAYVLFVTIFILTLLQFRLMGQRIHY
ncbi:MAG: sugar ABC transporter permease [Bacillota bacterium]